MNNLPVIIIGAGGHASVVADALLASGNEVIGFTDVSIPVGEEVFEGISLLGKDDVLYDYAPSQVHVAIGVGCLPGDVLRLKLFKKIKAMGFVVKTVQHPSSIVSKTAALAEGAQVMAGSIIQPKAIIGENVIVNTGAQIDHDSIIGDHSHVAPNATVCGGVTIGEHCFVGASSTVIQGLTIREDTVIPAGFTVTSELKLQQKLHKGKSRV